MFVVRVSLLLKFAPIAGGGEQKQSSRHRQQLRAFSVSHVMIDLHWLLSTVAGSSSHVYVPCNQQNELTILFVIYNGILPCTQGS